MKHSNSFLFTLREAPSDAEVVSHKLLAQAGFITKIAAGIYAYSPAMWRVLKKIENIIRDEMNSAGAQEVMLPVLQTEELWKSSGRWDRYIADGIMFHLKDRKQATMCLGPTHEEVITTLVNKYISSYKHLPVNLYQIQTKFRDEIRPRFGLMRGREFIMKDAYSFDIDDAGLARSYDDMAIAYKNIFRRCGFKFIVVDADPGAIGGGASQEFVVPAKTGEDSFLICEAASYAANIEKAESELPNVALMMSCCENVDSRNVKIEKVYTPNIKTINDLVSFFPNTVAGNFIKTIIYKATHKDTEEFIAVIIRGDCEINEVKLCNHINALGIKLAQDNEILSLTGASVGFAGPVELNLNVKVIADESILSMPCAICGANETNYHYKGVVPNKDFSIKECVDVRLAKNGELCKVKEINGKKLSDSERVLCSTRGIEVGHIFKLGTKYSSAMNAMFTAEDGTQKPFVMGCYGIGVSRVAAAALEQCHDEAGMIWPASIAPWQVHLLCLNTKKESQKKLSDSIYKELQTRNIEVLYDERELSPGVKFNDADLIGCPIRVIVGRDAENGKVEFSLRSNPTQKKSLEVVLLYDEISSFLKN